MLEPTVESRAVKAAVTALIDDHLKKKSVLISEIKDIICGHQKMPSFMLLMFDGLQCLG
jgi:hypothetical protein